MDKQKKIPQLRFFEYDGYWKSNQLDSIISNFIVPMRDKPKELSGDIPWCRIEDFNGKYLSSSKTGQGVTLKTVKEMNLKVYPINTLLVSCSANLGFCAIVKKPLITNQTFIGLVPDENSVHIEFLYYVMVLSAKKLNVLSSGTTISYLSREQFEKFEINIPTLPEQQKIATFFTTIDEKITQLKRKKTLLELYKKGVMQKIFSQEIRFKEDNGQDFPKWENKKLGEIAKFRRGSFPQPYGLEKWYDDINGSPFIQVFDVDDNFRLKSDTKNKISDVAKPFSVYVKEGTVVLTIQGSIGRIAITQYDSFVDRTLLIFEEYFIPINKYFFINIVYLLFQIEKRKAPGGTIKTITKEVLSDFEILIPCIQEQTKIANFLSSIDDKINHTQKQIDKGEVWKKGLMQQMFL